MEAMKKGNDPMPAYDPAIKPVLDALLLDNPHVRPGKMFGFPAYYVGKKLCICLYQSGVAVKLTESAVKSLLTRDVNARPFQPFGRAVMRAWVQIDLAEPQQYLAYRPILEEALQLLAQKQGL
jgi:hypothetical protein